MKCTSGKALQHRQGIGKFATFDWNGIHSVKTDSLVLEHSAPLSPLGVGTAAAYAAGQDAGGGNEEADESRQDQRVDRRRGYESSEVAALPAVVPGGAAISFLRVGHGLDRVGAAVEELVLDLFTAEEAAVHLGVGRGEGGHQA
uniref:Uncharacterized protein n=1 Tax=Lygus hesperus TaxID=30085 RepID=A0A146L0F1_LYGHE